jgi:hypothetical protein
MITISKRLHPAGGVQNCVTDVDLAIYAAHSYSLTRPGG